MDSGARRQAGARPRAGTRRRRPPRRVRRLDGERLGPIASARPADARWLDVGVGDWVGMSDGLIRTVLPRRSAIVRNAAGLSTTAQTLAANVDVAFVVSSLGPDLEPRRIERYLVTIWESGASPEIVLTKADRLDDPWTLVAEVEAVRARRSRARRLGRDRPGLRRAAGPHRRRHDGRPARLVGRRQVDARQPLARRGGDGDARDARRRRRGPPHDDPPPAARPAGRRARDRHARPPRAPALGRRRSEPGGDVRGRRGARRRLPLRRLHAHARAGLRRPRRRRDAASYRPSVSTAGASCSGSCARSRCVTTCCCASRSCAAGSCARARAAPGRGTADPA